VIPKVLFFGSRIVVTNTPSYQECNMTPIPNVRHSWIAWYSE
jgi:hypothetical protein